MRSEIVNTQTKDVIVSCVKPFERLKRFHIYENMREMLAILLFTKLSIIKSILQDIVSAGVHVYYFMKFIRNYLGLSLWELGLF